MIPPDHVPASPRKDAALAVSDAIIDISADAIISTNETQEIIRFNRGAEDIFGYTESEIIGQRIEILIPSRFHASHPSQVRGFAESPVVARRMGERRQISGVRKSGEEFPAEASISKTRVNDEWIFTVALRDVTDRVRAEAGQRFLAQASVLLNGSLDAKQTLENMATLALPTLGDWCVVFLDDGKGGLERALAVHSDPAMADVIDKLRHTTFAGRAEHPLMQCVLDGAPLLIPSFDEAALRAWSDNDDHEATLRALSPASAMAVPMRARDHTIGAISFFFSTAVHRVHTEDDLDLALELARRAAMALDNAGLYARAQAAVAARDDVLAVVSHDLGNPLAAIRLSSTLLLRQIPGGEGNIEAAMQQVDNIRSAAFQMERLIKDLLDIKRIEAGFLALDRERVLMRSLLDEVIETYAPLAAAKGISLDRVTSGENFHVIADRERLQQVFSNLVGNALKFTPADGSIRIGATAVPGFGLISISDSGSGIPAEHLPHIFDRFWQASRLGRQGIGLGLAIVKGIVDAHGGDVEVQSEAGHGTTFTIRLPM